MSSSVQEAKSESSEGRLKDQGVRRKFVFNLLSSLGGDSKKNFHNEHGRTIGRKDLKRSMI